MVPPVAGERSMVRLGCCWQRAFRHQRPPRHRPGRGGLGDAESSASFSRYRVCSSQTSRHQSQNRACSRRTTPRWQAPTRRDKRTRTLSAAATPARHTRRADASPSPSPQGPTPISSNTHKVSNLLAGSINRPSTNCLKTSSPPLAVSNPSLQTQPTKHSTSAPPATAGSVAPAVVAARPRNRVRPDQRRSCAAAPPLSTPQHPPACVPTRCDPSTAIHETTTTPPEPLSPPTRSSPSSHTDSPQQAKTPPISAHHTNQNP